MKEKQTIYNYIALIWLKYNHVNTGIFEINWKISCSRAGIEICSIAYKPLELQRDCELKKNKGNFDKQWLCHNNQPLV